MKYLMKCGHVSNATNEKGYPVCLVCLGIFDGATDIQCVCYNNDGLEGRKAKCTACGVVVSSRWDLPFFEYRSKEEYDLFYSGCMGWE